MIEGLTLTVLKKTLTTIVMEHYVPNDHMRCWRVTFGVAIHSSCTNDIMTIISEGEKY